MGCTDVLARGVVRGVAEGDPSEHVDLEPTPTAARRARAFVAEHASGLDAEAADAAAVCASELVTNGVLHARTVIVLGVTRGAHNLLVTVEDQAGGQPAVPPQDDERTSGRGLMLVQALASQWGVCDGEDGKTVWFTVPRRAR